VANNVDSRALQRAAGLLGGLTQLRDYLGVPTPKLVSWLEGSEPTPDEVFLKAIEVVVRAESDRPRSESN
jgi:hypothetical protein